ncbi:ABC transporter ATP-binding protein [Salinicoccus halodurans]|uniref:Oligopeptide transport system ATP-binding protein n=1 Tax=Salinicoccus halodurans TaxID=407035 RepID=A0A0F7HIE8_9STAP|nr:ATP-binding cassette domain-containing protein [Salinicoccus halodurans]AKG73028.1 peptide ABC transporter ATP-binding protein [Salinicoccus halodurans]SFK77702.1 oligopeptide transport system ATP-binding protein [Salinicoccus halodurans]
MAEPILTVNNLKKHFGSKNNLVKAVDDVSFHVMPGETLGLVGESGCGKSTTGRTIINLYDKTGGEILFDGKNNDSLSKKEQKQFHQKLQMIFQDPYASLNPRMTVFEILEEGYDIHKLYKKKKERRQKIYELLESVGLNREHANRYPHEFSGGQRQRIGIARALSFDPKLIIADEPISALDVSIQAQVVNMMKNIQRERGLAYLFIAHDLSMVKYISDRIAVMYKGKIMEIGDASDLYDRPFHPYTKSLLSAVPQPDPHSEKERRRVGYDESMHGYNEDEELKLRDFGNSHLVYCSQKEYESWTV